MLKRVQATIEQHHLLAAGQHVLAAVSGGPDSVALLAALCRLRRPLRFRLTVCHLNHRLRAKAAEADARFVARLARRLRVPCEQGRADVSRRAAQAAVSLEMAARAARHAFFARTARKVGADLVATGHTADDQAETFLLRLCRGAGGRGLGAMRYAVLLDGLRIVRPLLDVCRKEVLRFLHTHGLTWREDASNRDPAFLRNRVRHELLPLLARRLNPDIATALRRAAELARADELWLEECTHALLRKAARPAAKPRLDVDTLASAPLAARRRVIRLWLAQNGVPLDQIDFVACARAEQLVHGDGTSRIAPLPGGWRVRREYDELLLSHRAPEETAPPPFRLRVAVPGDTVCSEQGLRVTTEIAPGIVRGGTARPGKMPARASLSLATLGRRALFIRAWRAGDRIAPLGLRGSKKLQDVFVDAKLPRTQRLRVPLFEAARQIVWVPGYRIAQGWEVRDADKPALQVRIQRV